MSRRIRMTVAYDGTGFHGWQVQPGLPTIQGVLEEIIGGMEKKAVPVAGSGRTDAGVHALAQVAAVTLDNPIPLENFVRAVNRLLPPAIRVLSAEEVDPRFHPRFDAIAKTYEYRIVRTPIWDRLPEEQREAFFETRGAALPVGRVGEPADVADAYLCFMRSAYTTGQIVVVDGGMLLV